MQPKTTTKILNVGTYKGSQVSYGKGATKIITFLILYISTWKMDKHFFETRPQNCTKNVFCQGQPSSIQLKLVGWAELAFI